MPLVLVDYPVAVRTSTSLAAEPTSLLIEFDPVPNGYVWRVDQITVCAFIIDDEPIPEVAPGPFVILYDQYPGPMVVPIQATQMQGWEQTDYSGTLVQQFGLLADFDDQGSPLTIRGGNQLIVAFQSDYGDGTVLGARIQYGLYQGTAGQATPVAGARPAPAISQAI